MNGHPASRAVPTARKESFATSHAIVNAHTVVLDEGALRPWEPDHPAASFYCDQVAEIRTLKAGDLIDPATKYCEWCGKKLRRSAEVRALEFSTNPDAPKWVGITGKPRPSSAPSKMHSDS